MGKFKMPENPVVDIHTHMYPAPYLEVLKKRSAAPYVRTFPEDPDSWRLFVLPAEEDESNPSTARGRPIGHEYSNVEQKIAFMDRHGIDVSVISLANPWLDFIEDPDLATSTAEILNDWFNDYGVAYDGRIFAFGALPMRASVRSIVAEIHRIKKLGWIRGVVMGTDGCGKGLDDPDLMPVWQALNDTQTMVFLHPKDGLPNELYGPQREKYGHVLPLALGFPLETTIAITRMILSGVFEKMANLKMLLAHSGGTLPFLAGRIQSCIDHDAHVQKSDHLVNKDQLVANALAKNIYLDAVIYDTPGLKAAIDAVSVEKIMFGTDHPFFPPIAAVDDQWASVESHKAAIFKGLPDGDQRSAVLGKNAMEILKLKGPD